ncbi:Membrane protease YdiL, CAAX protease family [Actinokineospora alba]|uniref:Membrane protease YdiL, CAAX protease family n=1 Tax=Actinokineospora alba TaxID=504798 RepID=A0A1H0QS09_9PSEU|nr:type II CAAX endopeptidase family protein [Actinokineospora alba]TDP70443.1 membrane protease YdiL (CAAX protease family) [Actinokineospora alba]SDI31500.1 Membrane protease YdiL, CAAX protease family [Actinokineospora alba]SDP19496.1 Membrane protease YdiL, CAAX protease family [Actinokineospora alba]
MATRIGQLPGTPYHLQAKTAAYRWWKPLLALVLVSVVFALGQALGLVLQVVFDLPEGSLPWGMLPLVAGLAVTLVPGVMLIARVVDRRPGGTVSSVLGRIRLPWLGWCFLIAALMLVAVILLRGETLALSSVTPLKLVPVLVYLPFIVFQAAGEEYVFRGLLVQSFASWFRTPWIGALISTALFGLAHDYSDPMIIAEFVVFSLAMVWITLRTGGLEATVAYHSINNLLALSVELTSGVHTEQGAAQFTPREMIVTIGGHLAFAALITWLAARKDLARTASPAIEQE